MVRILETQCNELKLLNSGESSMDETFFNAVTSSVGVQSKESLDQVYKREEIELPLKDMNPTKSPGPDGMPARFFQQFWNLVGNDVVEVCLRFLMRELLRKGVRWRIGDGKDVRVFIDPWVPGLPSFRPILRQGAPLFLRASELMLSTGGWNMEALNYWFTEDECEKISSITVGATQRPDVYMWNYCKNGRYMVKSGYWLACEEKREEAAIIVQAPRHFWKHLWKLKVSQKIIHFL